MRVAIVCLLVVILSACGATVSSPSPSPTRVEVAIAPTNTPLPPAPTETATVPSPEADAATTLNPTPTASAADAPTETPMPVATATPEPPSPIPPIALDLVVDGLEQPVYVTHAGDGSNRLFVVERHGKIRVLENGVLWEDPFLDIDSLIDSGGQEQGLLSLAFHPRFPDDRRVFVDYTNNNGDTVVAAYQVSVGLDRVEPDTGQILMTIPQPYGNHNGGQLQFGPDGYLYIGTGDGGAANDPEGNGQNPASLLGKMLRISVDFGEPYTVPADNPFIGDSSVRPEVWAIGLRNPWRFSFDRLTGDLYIGDVGQNKFEEIDFEPAGSSGGLNFGWNVMEGVHCFERDSCEQAGLTLPITEYGRESGCSVTGGYVYRGQAYPQLNGVYFYADYCTGNIWGLRIGEAPVLVAQSGLNVSSFGEDEAGELYVVNLQGSVYRLAIGE